MRVMEVMFPSTFLSRLTLRMTEEVSKIMARPPSTSQSPSSPSLIIFRSSSLLIWGSLSEENSSPLISIRTSSSYLVRPSSRAFSDGISLIMARLATSARDLPVPGSQ